MMKAGLIEEMMSDAIDSAIGGEDEEEETEEEVQKVLDEIALATASALPSAQVRVVWYAYGAWLPGRTTRPSCLGWLWVLVRRNADWEGTLWYLSAAAGAHACALTSA